MTSKENFAANPKGKGRVMALTGWLYTLGREIERVWAAFEDNKEDLVLLGSNYVGVSGVFSATVFMISAPRPLPIAPRDLSPLSLVRIYPTISLPLGVMDKMAAFLAGCLALDVLSSS
ncbi:hypothetical protein HOY82DRAFT_599421 [Tuber indicum]|nr:hypothetical protein HOY82DRAFT_599421 [Tuber indicum]